MRFSQGAIEIHADVVISVVWKWFLRAGFFFPGSGGLCSADKYRVWLRVHGRRIRWLFLCVVIFVVTRCFRRPSEQWNLRGRRGWFFLMGSCAG